MFAKGDRWCPPRGGAPCEQTRLKGMHCLHVLSAVGDGYEHMRACIRSARLDLSAFRISSFVLQQPWFFGSLLAGAQYRRLGWCDEGTYCSLTTPQVAEAQNFTGRHHRRNMSPRIPSLRWLVIRVRTSVVLTSVEGLCGSTDLDSHGVWRLGAPWQSSEKRQQVVPWRDT